MQNTTFHISEPAYILEKTLEEILFPPISPYSEGYLSVTERHQLWYAEYGNPKGVPIVVIHGGPGFGCSPNDMRYFDPGYFRIVLFDQRGAKRSKPFGELFENTASHLTADMESLRKHLNITQWFLFGGSWGSALALLYAEAYPDACLGLVLRGIFLGRKQEYEQVWYGMKDTFPEEWDALQKFLSKGEREDLINSYYTRLMDPNPEVHMPAARVFIKYDFSCAFLKPDPGFLHKILQDEVTVLGIARTFTHYCKHGFFLKENEIVENLSRICHLPLTIVHGRYDVICRASAAYELHQKWTRSNLVFVQDAGHSAMEPGIAQSLIEATENFKKSFF